MPNAFERLNNSHQFHLIVGCLYKKKAPKQYNYNIIIIIIIIIDNREIHKFAHVFFLYVPWCGQIRVRVAQPQSFDQVRIHESRIQSHPDLQQCIQDYTNSQHNNNNNIIANKQPHQLAYQGCHNTIRPHIQCTPRSAPPWVSLLNRVQRRRQLRWVPLLLVQACARLR
jgi:hypothetical protein